MNAPVIRSFHQSCERASATQSHEMFQSSITSWSSKIIALGTVESSQRMSGSLHASRYRWAYSSKSATSSPGGCDTSRRERMNSTVAGLTSSAYTWSPIRSSPSGHGSEPALSRLAYAHSASTPNPCSCSVGESVYGSRSGAPTRQEPNTSRAWRSPSRVWIALGGWPEPGSGQTGSPSSSTLYSVTAPSSRPVNTTSAKWCPKASNVSAVRPSTATVHLRSASTQTVASDRPTYRSSGPRRSDAITRDCTQAG